MTEILMLLVVNSLHSWGGGTTVIMDPCSGSTAPRENYIKNFGKDHFHFLVFMVGFYTVFFFNELEKTLLWVQSSLKTLFNSPPLIFGWSGLLENLGYSCH